MSATVPETSLVGRSLDEIETPALIVDVARFESNLRHGQEAFCTSSIAYRPHSKSHKSSIVARKQLEHGAIGICCAKLSEAEVMLEAGITNILVTGPVVEPGKIERLVAAAASAPISVVVDDAGNVSALEDAAARAGTTIGVLIELDVGQGRCGVRSTDDALALARLIAGCDQLRFLGIQGYHGSIQMVHAFAERERAVGGALERLLEIAEIVRGDGIPVDVLTGGGTGSAMIDVRLGGLGVLQPGSYVFMDNQYERIEHGTDGGASRFDRALSILGTVISRPSEHKAILDVGLKAASIDGGAPEAKNLRCEGFTFAGDEHGVLTYAPPDQAPRVGAKVELYPSHSDTTVNLYDTYVVVRDGFVEDIWPIEGRGKTQ